MPAAASPGNQQPVSQQCPGLLTQLVLRCGQGDESALGDLFDLTYFLVAAAVHRYPMSVKGADEEVVGAYRRIWLSSATFVSAEQDVLAWVLDHALAPTRAHAGASLPSR